MSLPAKTTIILVPGAWHGPEWFDQIDTRLQAAGYQTSRVTLPSVGPKEHLANMQPDVDAIRQQIETAADAGQKVVLVAHRLLGAVDPGSFDDAIDLSLLRRVERVEILSWRWRAKLCNR